MRRKADKYKEPVKCIVFLSSSETEDWDKAKRKEDKQLRYINAYAKKHSLIPMEIVRRGCFGAIETNKILNRLINKMDSGKADAVLVANALSISRGVADAYAKVGKVIEAGHRFITVDEGELHFDLYDPESGEVVNDGN
ncbi:MAG: recombinase family protein [Eubacterium sp.]|nr:recombinase family protein [Eubacterium sp.]